MCKLYSGPPSGEKIEEMRKIVLNTLEDIRIMIQDLRPAILDDLGLEAAIRWLLYKHLWSKGITYFLNIMGDRDRRFDPHLEATLFRIIQEAIVNIARHSEAENVFVIMKTGSNEINLDIEDDGKGFDIRSALKRTEDGRVLGLMGMKERVYLRDGKVLICSEPGSGTRISLWIPLKSPGDENV
jgi:signal transduction histidine kinase